MGHGKEAVLITGASGGLGQGIAKELAAAGHPLLLSGHKNLAGLQKQKTELEKNYSIPVVISAGEIGDPGYVEELFRLGEDAFGPVEWLVNNAGISQIGLFSELSIEEWNRILEVNLTSVYLCIHRALPGMIHRKSGHILNISSVWGTVGASCEVAYSATKSGINGLTRALAKELAPSNIAVNALSCGLMDTPMNAGFSPKEKEALLEEIPAGRMGTPKEAGEMALHLLSSPVYLTGQIVTLDGGWIG